MIEVATFSGALIKVLIEGAGYNGAVVIDTLFCGTSSGGVRIAERVPEEEIESLAREMSLKYAYFALARGGAKGGISIPDATDRGDREAALLDFGKKLGCLTRAGLYYPGMDLNCGESELRQIYRGVGLTLGPITDSSYFTAVSVAQAVYSCRETIFGSTAKLRMAVEGFGRVATHLIRSLPEDQFTVVAFSTIHGARESREGFGKADLLRAREEHGDWMVQQIHAGREIERAAALEVDADILIPSSRTWVLDGSNAPRVQARVVVPIANAPYTADAAASLQKRGVACLPGFVTNAGGVYGSSMSDLGVATERVVEASRHCYAPMVRCLLEESLRRDLPTIDLASAVAKARVARRALEPKANGLVGRGANVLARRFRPRRLRAAQALRAFQRNLLEVVDEIKQVAGG